MKERKILIIDDDDNILKIIQLNLEKLGYHVLLSGDGEDGFEKIRMIKPNLVITDFMIPGMSGLEVLKKTKEKYPEIIVIFMTAYGSQKIAVDAMKKGADDYVIKPFIPEELMLMVEKHIENKRIRKENEKLREKLEEKEKKIEMIQSRMSGQVNIFYKEKDKKIKLSSEYSKVAEIVAQEFINPLSIFSGYLQFLTKNEYKDKDILIKMNKILDKVEKSIKDLIVFSNSEKNPILEWININYIIEEVLKKVEEKFLEKDIHLIKNFHKDIPNIRADSNQIHHAFYNLILNAIYFTENNGEISVSTKYNASKMYIEIADNGKGIAKENLSKIFTPFFTTKPPGKGLGLGLSIVDNVIQNHNGIIKVKSKINKGSSIIIIIPQN
ncbi:MAG: response regulator [Candidatus Helarchaeota archaeon]|nr:response regulator [Candidatus Helarchaeota archaeon]